MKEKKAPTTSVRGGVPALAAPEESITSPVRTSLLIAGAIPRAGEVDWAAVGEDLHAASEKLRRNDMSRLEDMLMHQAVALQLVFTRLTSLGLTGGTLQSTDLLLRYGMKAQAQCRATLETLATMKNPPAVYARQANVTTGPQQINNGAVVAAAPGRDTDELHPNGGAPALASPADPAMATLGARDRPAHGARQGDVVAQRLEGKRASGAAQLHQGTS